MEGPEVIRPPTDADRTRVIEALRIAGPGLTFDEMDRRMDAAVRAQSMSELALLVFDLPEQATHAVQASNPPVADQQTQAAGPPALADDHFRTHVFRNAAFRAHATAYGMVNTMLVGIWALTDVHDLFWPFFPIAGWGIGLGMHAVGEQSRERHVHNRELRRAEKARQAIDRLGDDQALPAGKSWKAREESRESRGARAGQANGSTAKQTDSTAKQTDSTAKRTGPSGSGRSQPVRTSAVVMFTDIVDSTRLTMVIGDEDWLRVRSRYREMLHECYDAHRGIDVNSQGDGFLGRFETAAEAVSCAIAIQTRLHRQRKDIGFAPTIRVGINSGDAMDEGGNLLGAAVNLAARVMSLADPGEILITEAVADRLDDRFPLEDLGLRDLKGIDRRCHVLSVKWGEAQHA